MTASYGSFGSSNLDGNFSYGGKNWGNFIAANGLDTGPLPRSAGVPGIPRARQRGKCFRPLCWLLGRQYVLLTHTRLNAAAWGLSLLTAQDEMKLLHVLTSAGKVLTTKSRDYVLWLMSKVTSSQRWACRQARRPM